MGQPYRGGRFKSPCGLLLNGQTWQILALSKYYQVPIYVIQADSPVVKVGESEKNQKGPLTISYHRRAFGLGEHCELTTALDHPLSDPTCGLFRQLASAGAAREWIYGSDGVMSNSAM